MATQNDKRQQEVQRVKAWRKAHPEQVRQSKRRYYRRTRLYADRKYLAWEVSEDLAVIAREVQGQPCSDRQLSKIIRRSVAAIQRRRSFLIKQFKEEQSRAEAERANQTATAGSSGEGNSGP